MHASDLLWHVAINGPSTSLRLQACVAAGSFAAQLPMLFCGDDNRDSPFKTVI